MAEFYTTAFQLRAKNSAGTVVATFKETADVGRHVSLPAPVGVWAEREGIDYADQSYFVGHKQTVVVDFTYTGDSVVIPGDTGYSSLQATLNALPAGGTLEYSLDGGTTWIPCRHDDPEITKPSELNNTVMVSLTLTSRAIVANPLRTS